MSKPYFLLARPLTSPLLAALLLGLGGLAQAQSSVTVFGIVDAGVQSLKNGDKTLRLLSTDGQQSSRFGLRGVEDLGGELKAGFHLEGALNPDTGTADSNRFWGRRATVSLISESAGEVRLGRDFTPTFWSISRFNVFGTNGVGGANNLIYGFDGSSSSAKTIVRSDNSVGYFLPEKLGGVYGQAMVAAGEGSDGKYLGLRLGYAAGPFDVAAALSETDNPGGKKFKVYNLGASYKIGDAQLMGLYHVSKEGAREQANYVLGATYKIGAGQLRASYVHSENSGDLKKGDYSGNLFAVGYRHNLSKRTSLYSTISRVDNSDKGSFVIRGGSAVQAGQSSTGIEAGITHSF